MKSVNQEFGQPGDPEYNAERRRRRHDANVLGTVTAMITALVAVPALAIGANHFGAVANPTETADVIVWWATLFGGGIVGGVISLIVQHRVTQSCYRVVDHDMPPN